MQTVFIRFSTHDDRVRGFNELATRGRVSSLPGEVYQVPIDALRLLDDQHVAYRRATDDEIKQSRCVDAAVAQHAAPPDRTLSGAVAQDGAVSGVLETVNVHQGCEFVVYPPIPGYAITCLFPESMLPQVRTAIKRNVTVRGSMDYDGGQPFPALARVTSLEVHPSDDELPSLGDLRGLAPGSTGGLLAVDFVRSLRND